VWLDQADGVVRGPAGVVAFRRSYNSHAAVEKVPSPFGRGWSHSYSRHLRHCHPLSHETVAGLLRGMGYSLQSHRKTEEGSDHPDRDAQFRHINEQVRHALARGWPFVSVDTKKKELIGNYVNAERQWRYAKQPLVVNSCGFPRPSVGAVPCARAEQHGA
jgi:hypothetical protein